MTRPSDPPGVTYQGGYPTYRVLLHGQPVGIVESTRRRHPTWDAYPVPGTGHFWSGVNRGEAVAPLIAWHQAGRP